MNLLFISFREVNERFSGGDQCTNRNYKSFCELLGPDNVEILVLTRGMSNFIDWKILRRIYALLGLRYGLSPKKLNYIAKVASQYKYIFIDSSGYGIIARRLKKMDTKERLSLSSIM